MTPVWKRMPNGSLLCEGRGAVRLGEDGCYYAYRGSLGWGPFLSIDEAKAVLLDDAKWREELFPRPAINLI